MLNIVETHHQAGDCSFAGTRVADQRRRFVWLNREAYPVQNPLNASVIGRRFRVAKPRQCFFIQKSKSRRVMNSEVNKLMIRPAVKLTPKPRN